MMMLRRAMMMDEPGDNRNNKACHSIGTLIQ
jgi:hypothetical protein